MGETTLVTGPVTVDQACAAVETLRPSPNPADPWYLRLRHRGVARFHIVSSEAGRIEMVADDNKRTLAAFTHGPMGMVTAIRQASTPSLDLAWASSDGAARGDSPDRSPVHLAKAGKRSYRCRISDGVIYPEQSGSTAATRRLRIGVQYGRIRWVKESD